MESSPAATMAPPPASSSRSRDPLLFASFALPSGWGCRRPMAFCRDTDCAHVTSEPAPNAAAELLENKGSRSPAKEAAAAEDEVQEAPRKQWNLRDRTTWRDYRAEDARRQHKKLGNTEANNGKTSRGFSVPLTRQEIDADFVAITGRKPPRKPKKRRPKAVQRQIENICPGSSLAEVTPHRYKVNEKGGF